MKIKTIPVGFLDENCYIVSLNNGDAVAIDCGDEADKILEYLRGENLTLRKILLTHGHFDHINAVARIVEQTGAEVFIHEADAPMLTDAKLNLSYSIPEISFNPVNKSTTVKNNDIIKQDDLDFSVMHTKGHTQGGVCYICENVIFSGDTLFAGDVGRTDFPGGSYSEIIESVKKIAALDGDYIVYPGHGPSTTLDTERKTNFYINR